MTKICSFCNPDTIAKQEISTSDFTRILYPRRPIIPASVLIIPIRCVEHTHNLSDEEIIDIFAVVKKLHLSFHNLYGTTGYNLFTNDGHAADQHIPHVHFHFYGRSEDEAVNPFKVMNNKEKYKGRPQMPASVYRKNLNQIKNSIRSM